MKQVRIKKRFTMDDAGIGGREEKAVCSFTPQPARQEYKKEEE